MLLVHEKILSWTDLVRTAPAMTPVKTIPTLFLALLSPSLALAAQSTTGLPTQDPVVDAIYAVPDEEMQVSDLLDQLSNGIGPRLTSSQKLTEACDWAAERFRAFGLQQVRLEEWGSFPVGFDRRFLHGRMLAPEKRELVFTTRAWMPGTKGPSRGPALLAPKTEDELAALRGHLAGAWIVASSLKLCPRFNGPPEHAEPNLRDQFGELCAAEGIAGVIRPGRNGNLVVTSGNFRIDWEHLPQHVEILLRRDQFRRIFDFLQSGQEVELEFDIDQSFRQGPVPLYNVLAEIPGSDLAEQMVIFGAHIDSWDGARGAQDNGTGTSTTLEAARLLQQILREQNLQPRRTIRFMLWSGEEQGLLGSRAYLEQHPEELPNISAVIVHDGGTNACSGINTTPDIWPLFEEAFAPVIQHTASLEDPHLHFRLVAKEKLPRGVGSDHDAYLSAGVPGFFWDQFGTTNYIYIHHTQHDFTSEVREDYQRASARVIASAAWRLANMEPMVPRTSLGESAPRQRLGIYLGEKAMVDDVVKGSLAARAGLQEGDRLLRIDDVHVQNRQDIRQAMNKKANRRKVVWQRGEKQLAAWFDWKNDRVETTEP